MLSWQRIILQWSSFNLSTHHYIVESEDWYPATYMPSFEIFIEAWKYVIEEFNPQRLDSLCPKDSCMLGIHDALYQATCNLFPPYCNGSFTDDKTSLSSHHGKRYWWIMSYPLFLCRLPIQAYCVWPFGRFLQAPFLYRRGRLFWLYVHVKRG